MSSELSVTEKLLRDIETMKVSIRVVREELTREGNPASRKKLHQEVEFLTDELKELLSELWISDD